MMATAGTDNNSTSQRRTGENDMAETQIEWTDSTWNPVAGYSIITAGFTHRYDFYSD
jgi:hypothetical protein